jgi:preprotein translocase subunit YajC
MSLILVVVMVPVATMMMIAATQQQHSKMTAMITAMRTGDNFLLPAEAASDCWKTAI